MYKQLTEARRRDALWDSSPKQCGNVDTMQLDGRVPKLGVVLTLLTSASQSPPTLPGAINLRDLWKWFDDPICLSFAHLPARRHSFSIWQLSSTETSNDDVRHALYGMCQTQV